MHRNRQQQAGEAEKLALSSRIIQNGGPIPRFHARRFIIMFIIAIISAVLMMAGAPCFPASLLRVSVFTFHLFDSRGNCRV